MSKCVPQETGRKGLGLFVVLMKQIRKTDFSFPVKKENVINGLRKFERPSENFSAARWSSSKQGCLCSPLKSLLVEIQKNTFFYYLQNICDGTERIKLVLI